MKLYFGKKSINMFFSPYLPDRVCSYTGLQTLEIPFSLWGMRRREVKVDLA